MQNRCEPRKGYTDEDIRKALEEVDSGKSIRSTGKKYGIPEATLRHKKTGYHPVPKKMGPKTVLSDAEEEMLVAYIVGSTRRAQPVTRKNIIDAVHRILEEEERIGQYRSHTFVEGSAQRKWWQLFRSRHPNITFRTLETLTKARLNVSEVVIRQWFADAASYFAEDGLAEALSDPRRIFNIDESGFSLSPKQHRVLAIRGEKNVFEVSGQQQKNITVLGNVSASGEIPPPMIIYPRKRISHQIAERIPTGLACAIGKSDKGYITFETLYEYLCNSFNDWLTENNIPRPVIVWTDWHESRNNYFLATTLKELNVILYGLPPNTTHFMQPLDVAVFEPLKKSWSSGAKEFERTNPDTAISQINFAEVFLPIYYSTISTSIVQSGFAKCGLCPFNSDAPDYSKLKGLSAQYEEPSTILEGIDQGGIKDQSCQTVFTKLTHRWTQTSNKQMVAPSYMSRKLQRHSCQSLSMDDTILNTHDRDLIITFLTHGLPQSSTMPEDPQTPGPSTPQTEPSTPQTAGAHSTPSTSDRRISEFFKKHIHYPEKSQGQGPKVCRTALDRTFAISSDKAIALLKRQREEREKKAMPKRKRGRAASKKTTPSPAEPVISTSSSDEENLGVRLSDSDSLDESLLDNDPDDPCLKLPLTKPTVDDWVGVKVEKVASTSKGRNIRPYEIHLGRVKEIRDEGMAVTFLKEIAMGFYVHPEIEDISFPVLEEEVIVLNPPEATTRNRRFGFVFNSQVKSSVAGFLAESRPTHIR